MPYSPRQLTIMKLNAGVPLNLHLETECRCEQKTEEDVVLSEEEAIRQLMLEIALILHLYSSRNVRSRSARWGDLLVQRTTGRSLQLNSLAQSQQLGKQLYELYIPLQIMKHCARKTVRRESWYVVRRGLVLRSGSSRFWFGSGRITCMCSSDLDFELHSLAQRASKVNHPNFLERLDTINLCINISIRHKSSLQ
jgi:hypothetical protein